VFTLADELFVTRLENVEVEALAGKNDHLKREKRQKIHHKMIEKKSTWWRENNFSADNNFPVPFR
jgi:hypothetical protein